MNVLYLLNYAGKAGTERYVETLVKYLSADGRVKAFFAYNEGGLLVERLEALELFEVRYYALQKDNGTASWKQEAKKYGFKPILMAGDPEKNKVDNKIIKDAKKMLVQNKQVDIFCIVSRDSDFTDLVKYLREHKKRVVVLATKQTSKRLKNASSEVKGI